jgi:hypothetical protein
MGILDDAIRDHIDLKRRRGTDEPEIKRLEDEAFGPPGRPDASGVAGPTASAVAEPPVETASPEITPEDLGLESIPETPPPSGETPPPDGPAPEEPPAPAPETTSDAGAGFEPVAESGGEVAFHDFAAEEGLVSGRSQAEQPIEPSDPVERALAQPTDEPSSDAPEAEAPAPHSEDTQVHDMAKELEVEPETPSAPPGDADADDAGESGEGEPALELDVEELEIELDDELELGEGEATSADAEGDEAEGDEAEGDEDGEDVLEETPEFLRDAPESDRLWFEQGKPKDFDFDDE